MEEDDLFDDGYLYDAESSQDFRFDPDFLEDVNTAREPVSLL